MTRVQLWTNRSEKSWILSLNWVCIAKGGLDYQQPKVIISWMQPIKLAEFVWPNQNFLPTIIERGLFGQISLDQKCLSTLDQKFWLRYNKLLKSFH